MRNVSGDQRIVLRARTLTLSPHRAACVWSLGLALLGCGASSDAQNPTDTDADAWRRKHTAQDGGTASDAGTPVADGGTTDGGSSPLPGSDAGASPSDAGSLSDADAAAPVPGLKTCTQTFNPGSLGNTPYPGAALQTALEAARGGEVFCLTAGAAGHIDLYNASPASDVTIQPAPGVSPSQLSADFTLNNVSHVVITGMTMSFNMVNGSNYNSFTYNAINSSSVIRDVPTGGTTLVAYNTFLDISPCDTCYEGRISVLGGSGVIVSHNFMSGGASDGIQIGGAASPPVQILYNEITNILQGAGGSSAHSDGIQTVGATGVVIRGNWIHGNSDGILMDDGGQDVTIIENVLGPNAPGGSPRDIEFGGGVNYTITHNTSWGNINFGDDHNGNHTTGLTLTNNIIWNGNIEANAGQPVTYVSEDYNLGSGSGPHDLAGSPTFVGGAGPSSFAGYALTSTSLGVGNASDGKNRGVTDFGTKPGP